MEERTYVAKKKNQKTKNQKEQNKMAKAKWFWDWLGLDANPNFLSY